MFSNKVFQGNIYKIINKPKVYLYPGGLAFRAAFSSCFLLLPSSNGLIVYVVKHYVFNSSSKQTHLFLSINISNRTVPRKCFYDLSLIINFSL